MRNELQEAAGRSDDRAGAPGRGLPRSPRRAFSLLELVVVLTVTLVLTGLLLPALGQVRENLNRVICSSNLRQLGYSVVMYARDSDDWLPYSSELAEDRPEELMLARLGTPHSNGHPDGWEGLGLLHRLDYCRAQQCFYCPSHQGEHAPETYDWFQREPTKIYTNYHYAGHIDWQKPVRRRLEERRLLLAVDGLPFGAGFNHDTGMNALRGDGSVLWDEEGAASRRPVPGAERGRRRARRRPRRVASHRGAELQLRAVIATSVVQPGSGRTFAP